MYINCWYCDVSELNTPALFEKGLSALPWQARRERILSIRFQEDKLLHLGAGLLAAHALRKAGASDLTQDYHENQKPFLAAHPGIHFNLSHSGTLAVCAVSDAPVGVDVERERAVNWSLARRFFHPAELAWLERSADPDRDFTRLWTRKESYIKMTGKGLAQPLSSFCAVPLDLGLAPVQPGSNASAVLPALQEAPAPAHFYECTAFGHTISVCTGTDPSNMAPVRFRGVPVTALL